ncbi:hypothetical protein OIE66_20235 [Nonomuraea sp. NBC_01738]|uniref:hypothetical protein n=1 Tax=Nonomuraea sp. NBC_01738 TaxID=2976003 RepID=UPI002E0F931A|nr:hypothetical protein OIE66_20235 [Nonomuraea sp. NBC_01738]
MVRHLVGALAGLVALPALYYLTEAGARALRLGYAGFSASPAGLGYLAGAALLAAALALWPGLSPVAAVVCGLPLAAVGALFATELEVALLLAGVLPGGTPGEPAGLLAGVSGLYTLLGVMLGASALVPHRWRGR